jgi:cell division protein FtsN
VIIAFLGSSDLWGDARTMFDYAFRLKSGPATQMAKRAPSPVPTATKTATATAATKSRTNVQAAAAPRPSPTVEQAPVVAPAAEMPAWVTAARVDAVGSSGDGERFTVRFGPFDDDHSVEENRRSLAQDGYAPLVAGRALRLGAFTSRDRALHLAQRLQQSGYRPTVVSLY